MKTCDEVKDILPEMLPLISGTALEVQEHLSRCHECAELRDELAHTLHVLESSPGADELPEAFAGEVLARLPDDPGWSLAAPPQPRGQLVSYPRAFLQGVAAAALFAAGAAVAWNVRGGPTSLDANPTGWQPAVAQRDPYGIPGRAGMHTAPVAGGNRQPVVVVEQPHAATTQAHPVYADTVWQVEQRPLVRYVSQAGVLLEAVADLEAGDPRGLQVLTVTLQRSDLLDHGDELLQLLPEASEPGQLEIRRLIAGTQLVLRKVRNARKDATPEVVWALRREVRETGLLDAYRQLLVADQPGTPPPARHPDEPF